MSVMRILDANINRAAEGMRVLEDIARFELEHKNWCEAIKKCRHELRAQTPSLLHRDTKRDVGTQITTHQEQSRSSIIDIARAASNRCAEALRVVEEFLKLHGAGNSIETLRYEMYEISATIIKALGSMYRCQRKFCFVMTRDDCLLSWQETMQQAVAAGCDCVQIREKKMQTAELVWHVTEAVEIASKYGAQVIVNDRVDVMLAARASGVHLGDEDMSIQDARKLCGHEYIIGATVHSKEKIQEAVSAGADYIGVGSVFASQTKPDAKIVPADVLKEAMLHNHFAIGGITPQNVHELYGAGCKGIAVSSAIAHSSTPEKIVEQLLAGKAQPA
jgi:thiamine-phosphate pyrophosphorylase